MMPLVILALGWERKELFSVSPSFLASGKTELGVHKWRGKEVDIAILDLRIGCFYFSSIFFMSFFTSTELGLGFPRRAREMDGSLQGCRREGCVQQVKGEERAHTRTRGTLRRRQSFEHRHRRVEQSLPGSVLQNEGSGHRGWGHQTQHEEGEFGFSFFIVFTVFLLTFYKQLKTTTHHSYSGGEGCTKESSHME